MVIDFSDLKLRLGEKLQHPVIQTNVLLSNCRLIDEDSRLTSAYTDPNYLPFYYHLGSFVSPESVAIFGLRLGLSASCFFQGCKTASRFVGFQENFPGTFYSPRLARGNVRAKFKGALNVHFGKLFDIGDALAGSWDLAIIDEETTYDNHRTYLDVLWKALSPGGLLVMDYLTRHDDARRAFLDFSRGSSREPAFFATRYGVGMIQK